MYKKGYEKVESLVLSRNRIAFVDERLLSPNLKVSCVKYLFKVFLEAWEKDFLVLLK